MGFLLDLKKGINVTNPGFMEQVPVYGRLLFTEFRLAHWGGLQNNAELLFATPLFRRG